MTIINLRASEFHSASWQAGSLILGAILDEVFSRGNIPESQRNQVRIYCDEFAEFDMSGFERILASGRRFACTVCLTHQNLNQIDPKMRATILGNVGVKLIFGASYADSQILNKDIAGDPKAFDLTALLRAKRSCGDEDSCLSISKLMLLSSKMSVVGAVQRLES